MFQRSAQTPWPRAAVTITIAASLATLVWTSAVVADVSTIAPLEHTLTSTASPPVSAPPAKDPRLGVARDSKAAPPEKRPPVEDPAGSLRRGEVAGEVAGAVAGEAAGEEAGELAPLGPRGIRGPGGDADDLGRPSTPGLRLRAGRYRPDIAPPGVGIPVEAVVSWSPGAEPRSGSQNVRVFAHVRPHPSLAWTTIEMRGLVAAPDRYQAVFPCTPCHTRPQFWLQAIRFGSDGIVREDEAWWPPAGASSPAVYDVGYERVLEQADGTVLERFGAQVGRPVGDASAGMPEPRARWRAAGPRPGQSPGADRPGRGDRDQNRGDPRGVTTWTSPAWTLGGTADPLFAFGWTLEPAEGVTSRLIVAVRPGGMGPWTVVTELVGASPRLSERRIPLRDHLPNAAMVQIRLELVAEGNALARIADPRLVDITCTPGIGPDLDGDGRIGLADLLLVITSFGPCEDPAGCAADLDGTGVIDLLDALQVLSDWTAEEAATPPLAA